MGSLAVRWLLPCVVSASAAAQQPELATVRGRAIARDGKPVAGCAVGVFELGQHFTTKELMAKPLATTDGDGRYELRAKKDSYQIVVVTAKDHQVCVQRLQAEASAERFLPDALMLPGTTLRGRVRDANGKPIAGALVRVEDPLATDAFVMTWFESQAQSDERGIFEVPGVPRTGLRVTASARGYPGVSRLAAHDSPLDLTLHATGMVRGRVTDADGKPVAGVQVNAVTVERSEGAVRITTDGDGRFELTAPNVFRFRVGAYESVAPHRQFSSGLLSGPADDVAVTGDATKPRDVRKVTLRVVDATTKANIDSFFAWWSTIDTRVPASVLLRRPEKLAAFRNEAVLDVVRDTNNNTNGSILVEAPGHGFAIVAVPDEPNTPLVAELPAECVLTGQVIDESTGNPAAGAAVRALPQASMFGGSPDPWKTGAITDANGRYRIGGLAAGEYAVQAYGVGVQAAPSRQVKLTPDKEASLDLLIPKPAYLEFELVGDVAANSLARIGFGGGITWSGTNGGLMLEAPLPPLPAYLPLNAARTYKLGPVGSGEHGVRLWLPTRDRLGSGLTIPIGNVERGKPAQLQLPDLRQVLHKGRVHLPSGVPTERIAVIAHPRAAGDHPFALRLQPPFAVCLASDGGFVIDLPPGAYTLQLVDLESKLAFHTEAEERTFDVAPKVIEIRPTIRWLHVTFEPSVDKGPIVLQGVRFDVDSRTRGVPAMLGLASVKNGRQTGWRQLAAGRAELSWLIPETGLKVSATQNLEILSPASRGWQSKDVDTVVVEPGTGDVRATLRIPPPPDDATLLAPTAK